jgi:Domain of unknown function (DUF4872)/Butirosin biosynthesis protein H, N-terminal
MTEQKSLKKLVRDRMARTGESYTTAHRHITARHASAVPGVTPGYPGFGATAHQPSSLVRHLLAQAGLEVSEAIACGLGGGIGFLYAIFEYKQVDHPLLTIVAQHHPQPWVDAVTEHLRLPAPQVVTSSAAKPALAKLDRTLNEGRASQLIVGRGFLPWHDADSPEEAADPYPIVVAGRDGGDYLVDDGTPEPLHINSEQLGAAWAAHRKGRFGVTTLQPIETPVDLADAIRSSIDTTVRHLTGPVLGNSFDVNMGLSGMAKLVTELRDVTTKAGWTRRFGTPESFRIGMTRLADCLTWAHTAPGGTRPLYAEFLTEAGPIAGLDFADAAASAALSGARWTTIADAAWSAREAMDTSVLARIADLADEALTAETAMVGQLREALV